MSTQSMSHMSDQLGELFAVHEGPCVSIYMPTARRFSDRQHDLVRYRRLVDEATRVLAQEFGAPQVESLMAPLHELAANERFWEHTLDGLAVLRAEDCFKVHKLQRAVPERCIVADSFHIKPLLRIAQSADRFHVLAITRNHARLFQGNRYALDEVQLDAAFPATAAKALGEPDNDPHEYTDAGNEVDRETQRFFRAVDRAVQEQYSRQAGIPLLLAALPQHQPSFRAVSHNPLLVDEGIAINPDAIATDDLRERSWAIAESRYLTRLAGFVDDFHTGMAHDLATDALPRIALSVLGGRVRVLLVEDERMIPGRIDHANGTVLAGELTDAHTDDLLDDLAEWTLRMGGEVVIVPATAMPTASGAAAIYRY